MTVQSILRAKGSQVETIQPGAMVVTAVQRLVTMGIGALVVSDDGQGVLGVLAERDVVRALAKHGARMMSLRVSDVMSRAVPVCSPEDTISSAMAEMTRSRNRHLPVVDQGRLCGLISVGDVIKHRLEEVELEALVLRDARQRYTGL